MNKKYKHQPSITTPGQALNYLENEIGIFCQEKHSELETFGKWKYPGKDYAVDCQGYNEKELLQVANAIKNHMRIAGRN
jgi:hypothetical protein